MKPNSIRATLLAALALLLAGCDYDVPLTSTPTHKVDTTLLGDWVGVGDDSARLNLRQLDDSTYIAITDGEAYRAYHSDFAGLPFVSIQDLNSADRKYCIYTWKLAAAGRQLVLRRLNTKIVPENVADTATLQRLVNQHLADPKLLSEELIFRRK